MQSILYYNFIIGSQGRMQVNKVHKTKTYFFIPSGHLGYRAVRQSSARCRMKRSPVLIACMEDTTRGRSGGMGGFHAEHKRGHVPLHLSVRRPRASPSHSHIHALHPVLPCAVQPVLYMHAPY